MEFLILARAKPDRLGILPSSLNPPTLAHLALAEAALAELDEVVLVLPRVFPHKTYDGASFTQRADMLRARAGPPSATGRCRQRWRPLPSRLRKSAASLMVPTSNWHLYAAGMRLSAWLAGAAATPMPSIRCWKHFNYWLLAGRELTNRPRICASTSAR